jgi:hypothetical protein
VVLSSQADTKRDPANIPIQIKAEKRDFMPNKILQFSFMEEKRKR